MENLVKYHEFHINMSPLLTKEQVQSIMDQTNLKIKKNGFNDTIVDPHWEVKFEELVDSHTDVVIVAIDVDDVDIRSDIPVISGYIHVLQDRILANYDDDQLPDYYNEEVK